MSKNYHHDIKSFLENIDKDIQNNKLAIFVGSGISTCSGYPKWNDVIKKFAEPLGISVEKLENKDYLEIPDKYYYKFQNFEFKKLLKEIFDIKPTNRTLQEKILQINPYFIITTNWDDLLETTMLSIENRYYDIVNNDNDLSKVNNTKLIIKMHGSLSKLDDNDNAIVMRESDYVAYGENFPLIENYIKSIFSTKRVLFIGYSLSDRNVQQILHWVKNRTLNHILPYLIINGDYDEIEFSFYKERGIFLIYINEILDFLGKTSSKSYAENYKSILDLIINRNKFLQKNESIIDKLYNLFKAHEEINFLSPDLLSQILRDEFNISISYGIFGDNCLYINEIVNKVLEENLISIFNSINRLSKILQIRKSYHFKFSEKEIYVLKKLLNSNISSLSIGFNKTISCKLDTLYNVALENDSFSLYQSLLNYDFRKILQYCNEQLMLNVTSTEHTQLQLLKSFVLFKQESYEESILILQETQKRAYTNKDFFIYFIAKMNLQYICHIAGLHFHQNDNLKTFCEQYKIDSEKIQEEIYNLPPKYSKKYIFKTINFDYFYKRFFNIQKLYDSNVKTRNLFEKGGSSTNNDHNEIYRDALNIFLMINFNFMTIDKYHNIKDIYSKAFQAIIVNYSIIDDFSTKQTYSKLHFPVNQFKELDQFIFYLAINSSERYTEVSVFLKETLKINNNSQATKKEYKYLKFKDLENICNVMLTHLHEQHIKDINNSDGLLNKAIAVLSWTELDDTYIEKILHILIDRINVTTTLNDYYQIIYIFLGNQADFIKNNNLNLLESMLEKFILKFIIGNTFLDEQTMRKNNFTDIIFSIFRKSKYSLKISPERIFTYCSKLPIMDYPIDSLFTISSIYSLNIDLYKKLKDTYINALLNKVKNDNFENKDVFLDEIEQLLNIPKQ